MTSHVARLYAAAGALLVFFVLWAAIAAHPWRTAAPDPRVAALAAREQRVHLESLRVKRVLDRRYAAYRAAFAERERQIAAARSQLAAVRARNATRLAAAPAAPAAPAPATFAAPRIVTLPPVTITRTS